MKNLEVKSHDEKKNEVFLNAELKRVNDEEGVFEGYASTFGNVDKTGDTVAPGAFTESLKRQEPKVLWQHDMTMPVGKMLMAREDAKGLYVKVKIATNTQLGNDAYELMKEDIVNRLSIGYRVVDSEFIDGVRVLKELDLVEFSLVTIPANDEAQITKVKKLPNNERDFEEFLRENGYSRTAAKAICSRGIKGYQDVQREADKKDTPNDVQREADKVVEALKNLLKNIEGKEK